MNLIFIFLLSVTVSALPTATPLELVKRTEEAGGYQPWDEDPNNLGYALDGNELPAYVTGKGYPDSSTFDTYPVFSS